MAAYYNEIDPFAAAWLRELIKAGLIADGEVDERSIEQVAADDVRGFTQCHWFAGIGGWSYALRLAGWGDSRPVWTGSCPCQPFSIGGEVKGVGDKRHLWPIWFQLIRELRPDVVFGEQIASSAGHDWLAGVYREMESAAYSVGAANLCAASVQAKHPRQRLWFVAHAWREGLARSFTYGQGLCGGADEAPTEHGDAGLRARICFEPDPGALVRVDGLPRPVGQVRAFGNAIVPQVAQVFIESYMSVCP